MTLSRRRLMAAVPAAAVAGLSGIAAPAFAQDNWPTKPVRLIVPFPPGGGTDILSRLVAAKLTEVSKWTVVADNRAGAAGSIRLAAAARGGRPRPATRARRPPSTC